MKRKFVNILVSSSLAFGLVILPLVVLTCIYQKHLEFVIVQHAMQQPVALINHQLMPVPFTQGFEIKQAIAHVLLGFIFSIPVGFWLGSSWHKTYYLYRTTLVKQQAESLERVWQRSINS